MFKQAKQFSVTLLMLVILTLANNGLAHALTYQITVDTSSLYGTTGFLDLQLNPGNLNAPAAQALINGFSTDGTLGAVSLGNSWGNYSGTLPGAVTLVNSALTDYDQAITYGNTLTFNVTFSGAFLTASCSGSCIDSAFILSLFDGNYASLLSNDQLNGSLVTFQLPPGGGETYTNFGSPASVAGVAAVPLPPAFYLFMSGLGLILWVKRGSMPSSTLFRIG